MMTPEILATLRSEAEAARRDWFSAKPTPALRRYHESTQPAMVLTLLAEVERLRGEEQERAGQLDESETSLADTQARLDKVREWCEAYEGDDESSGLRHGVLQALEGGDQ